MLVFDNVMDLLFGVIHLVVFPYFAFLLAVACAAIFRTTRRATRGSTGASAASTGSRFLVLIPAHDEELVIKATVESAKSLNYPADLFEVVVCADNCGDETASLARAAGARVIERVDAGKKSKGYAIEFVIDLLRRSGELDALDAIVVVDADTIVHQDVLRTFDRCLRSGHEWIQAYDCVGNADESWRTRLLAYSFSLINGVTLLGLNTLGYSAGLRGNGMCFSTRGLARVPWKQHGLTEDLEYSWSVRIAGGRIRFDRDAVVYAIMPSQERGGTVTQRQRWEHGRKAMKRKLWPLLVSPHLRLHEKAVSAIELTLPSAATLLLIFCGLSVCMFVRLPEMVARHEYLLASWTVLSQMVATLGLAIYALAPFLVSLVPWRFGRSLVHLPYYMFWKTKVMHQAAPRAWVRTAREQIRGSAASGATSRPDGPVAGSIPAPVPGADRGMQPAEQSTIPRDRHAFLINDLPSKDLVAQ